MVDEEISLFLLGLSEDSIRLDLRFSGLMDGLRGHIPSYDNTHHYTNHHTNRKGEDGASTAGTETQVQDNVEKTLVLIRNPFDAIYALKQSKHEDQAYYTLFGKANVSMH